MVPEEQPERVPSLGRKADLEAGLLGVPRVRFTSCWAAVLAFQTASRHCPVVRAPREWLIDGLRLARALQYDGNRQFLLGPTRR